MQRIDQHSPEGKALQATIKKKLADYLGEGYNDEVLPLYIVVMLAHGTTEAVVVENLEAFLGEHAQAFTTWLFQHMGEASKVEALKIAANAGVAPVAKAAPAAAQAAAPASTAGAGSSAPTPASLATLKAAQAAPSATNQLSLSASESDQMSEGSDAEGEQASARQPAATQEQTAAQPSTAARRHSHEHAAGRRDESHHHYHRNERRHSDRARRDGTSHRHDRSDRYDDRRREHRRYGRDDGYREPARGRYERGVPGEGYQQGYQQPSWGGAWDPGWRPDYPPPPVDRYGWAPGPPPFADPYYDRGYAIRPYERQRYRSLSPPARGEGRWGNAPPDRYYADGHDRWHEDSRRQRSHRSGSGVPPEVDFEAKAQDVPPEFRRRPMSQLAHAQQRQQQDMELPEAQLRTESAPEMAEATQNGDADADAAQPASAFDRLSDWPAGAPLSRSLPAGLPQQQQPQQHQQQSVFARLAGGTGVANGVAHQPQQATQQPQQQQQQQQRQQQGSVWERLSGALPQSAAEANGNVWRRLGPSAQPQQQQQQQQLQQQQQQQHPQGGDDIAAMRAELAKVTSMLDQLRAGAQLERSAGVARANMLVQGQGPADLRSVTVTSVHPLALEHVAILRAHFGVCGRIVRSTVLRDRVTGLPSGKVHIEYTDILAARKALRLSQSLLLDRPVRVRSKARRF